MKGGFHFELMRELNNSLLNKSLTKGQNKKHTLEEDKQFYIDIRNKHPEAESSSWMQKNGHMYFYSVLKKKYKLSWHEFKLMCGFDDYDKTKKYSLGEDKVTYIEIRNKHPESESSRWMSKNEYSGLYSRIKKIHKLSWHEFKLMCGFDDYDKTKKNTLGKDKQLYIEIRNKYPESESSGWMSKNGYSGLYARIKKIHKLSWHDFKVSCGFNDYNRNKKYSLEGDKQLYIEIRNKHPEAKSSGWMSKNGFSKLYSRVYKNYKLRWHAFKLLCGFDDYDKTKKNTLGKDKQLYIEIRNKYPESESSGWMSKNGYSGLYARIKKIHNLSWHNFKKLCGFND